MRKHIVTRAVALVAVFIFAFSISGKGLAANITDIPSSSATEINYLIDRDIISGYGDGTFRPLQNVTRAEAAIMLGKALGLNGTKRATSFTDVGAGSTASGYIQSAADEGIIKGFSDSTYRPYDPITRGQMAYLLQKGFGLTAKSNVYFTDIAQSGTQYDAINMIATAGLTVGYEDGTFRPTNNVTRQESAVFVARGLNESFRVSMVESNRIAIDPGHGGSDPGAIGINGMQEKELNLDVSLKVESLLKQKGIQVVMTRRTDTYPTLSERVNIAVNSNADAFVSIHANAATPTASGTETYYSTAATRAGDSKQLATFIQSRLYPALETRDRGVKTAEFYVIDNNPLPAALVELGFITNSTDNSKLASDYYRNKAAEAIVLGIQDYYNWKN
jgi:N-acetylmuramoyl-L-alanine amidase